VLTEETTYEGFCARVLA